MRSLVKIILEFLPRPGGNDDAVVRATEVVYGVVVDVELVVDMVGVYVISSGFAFFC